MSTALTRAIEPFTHLLRNLDPELLCGLPLVNPDAFGGQRSGSLSLSVLLPTGTADPVATLFVQCLQPLIIALGPVQQAIAAAKDTTHLRMTFDCVLAEPFWDWGISKDSGLVWDGKPAPTERAWVVCGRPRRLPGELLDALEMAAHFPDREPTDNEAWLYRLRRYRRQVEQWAREDSVAPFDLRQPTLLQLMTALAAELRDRGFFDLATECSLADFGRYTHTRWCWSNAEAIEFLCRCEAKAREQPAASAVLTKITPVPPHPERPANPTAAYCLLPPNKARWIGETELPPRLYYLLETLLVQTRWPVPFEVLGDDDGDNAKKVSNKVSALTAALEEIRFPWTLSTKSLHIYKV